MASSERGRLVRRVRNAARTFAARASCDPAFMDGYRADPVGTLQALGMPAIAISDALRESGFAEPEVVGYLAWALASRGLVAAELEPFVLAECGFTCLWTAGPPQIDLHA
jgi:hypothetical protein